MNFQVPKSQNFWISRSPDLQIPKIPDFQVPRFPDAADDGRTLRSQPDPSPNAPRDQIRRKGPCCDHLSPNHTCYVLQLLKTRFPHVETNSNPGGFCIYGHRPGCRRRQTNSDLQIQLLPSTTRGEILLQGKSLPLIDNQCGSSKY